MKILLVLIFFLAQNSWGASGKEAWKHATTRGKVELLTEYLVFFKSYQEITKEELSDINAVTSNSLFSFFFENAWASGEMDCIYAGWPSRRVGGLCSSPARHNPDYNQSSCGKNQMQCQPMFFGKGLCVPTSTREQRNLAFTNCDNKFKASKKSPEDVFREIKEEKKEASLFELMDFADKICREGKQAGTGMCTRLKAAVERMRHYKTDSAAIEVEEKKAEKPKETEPVIISDKKEVRDPEVKKGLIQSIITANRAMNQINYDEDCEPELNGTDFDRSSPRPLKFDFVTSRTSPGGAWENTFVSDKTDGLRSTGFKLNNVGPNNIAGSPIDPNEKVEREWRFVSTDNSRRETYIWITDDAGSGYLSQLMESVMVILPRKMKPEIKENGIDLHVTLTTGEKVIFDKKTKQIKAGALKEGKVDLTRDRNKRKPAAVSYTGTGISIRVDVRGSDPRLIKGNAVITQNGKSCQVKASELWNQEDFRYDDDRKLVEFLNRKCRQKFSL